MWWQKDGHTAESACEKGCIQAQGKWLQAESGRNTEHNRAWQKQWATRGQENEKRIPYSSARHRNLSRLAPSPAFLHAGPGGSQSCRKLQETTAMTPHPRSAKFDIGDFHTLHCPQDITVVGKSCDARRDNHTCLGRNLSHIIDIYICTDQDSMQGPDELTERSLAGDRRLKAQYRYARYL